MAAIPVLLAFSTLAAMQDVPQVVSGYLERHFDMYPSQVDFWHAVPLAPGRVRIRSRGFHLEDNRRESRAARYLADRIDSATQSEDDELTQAVQGGLRSSGYDIGILSDKEKVVKEFQRWIRDRLPVSRLLQAPQAGSVAAFNREMVGSQ